MDQILFPGFADLEQSLFRAIQNYSNVHRGSGVFSQVTTCLYESSREIILDFIQQTDGLPGKEKKNAWMVLFGSPVRMIAISNRLPFGTWRLLSSRRFGLPLGVSALVVQKKVLFRISPIETGGGTVKLVSPNWVVWASAPDRFEAGTPPVQNVITLARAAQLTQLIGANIFLREKANSTTTIAEVFSDETNGATGQNLLTYLRNTMSGRNLQVPTSNGLQRYVNLDHAASHPAFGPVRDTFWRALRLPEECYPDTLAFVKQICHHFFNASQEDYDLVFTQNTTEAINLVARCIIHQSATHQALVINSLLDHHSNELPWRSLPGVRLIRLGVDRIGSINLQQLEKSLEIASRKDIYMVIVAVCAASNVLGTINDLHAISQLVHRYGAYLLVDAAQLAAHCKIDVAEAQIDFLAVSAHKTYAPFGSGLLLARRNLLGSCQDEMNRVRCSSEENIAGIAAFGKALELLDRVGMSLVESEEKKLTDFLITSLQRISGIEIFGITSLDELPRQKRIGVVSFQTHHVPHNIIANEMAEQGGIGVRCGCFCAHLLVKYLLSIHPVRTYLADIGSRLLPGFTTRLLPGLVRVSLGLENDIDDVNRLLETLKTITQSQRFFLQRWLASSSNGYPFVNESPEQQKISAYIHDLENAVFGDHKTRYISNHQQGTE